MAAFHGKQGSATFNADPVLNVTSWSIDATAEVSEDTILDASTVTASTHWKSYKTGFLTWTATVSGKFDETGELDPDLSIDLKDPDGAVLVLSEGLGADSVRMYTGTAFVTGISLGVTNDVETVTYTFQGSGALVIATSDAV